MTSALERRVLPANEYILNEGVVGDTAYLILDGTVEIRLGASSDSPKLLATLGKGDVVGEMSLFDNRPHMASAMAMCETTVAVLTKDDFKLRVDGMDTVMRGILRVMIHRLRLVGEKEIIKSLGTDISGWDK
jgi:CRP-like cAMP-binding protein